MRIISSGRADMNDWKYSTQRQQTNVLQSMTIGVERATIRVFGVVLARTEGEQTVVVVILPWRANTREVPR